MFTKPSFPKIYTNDYRDSSYKDKELQKVKEKISILTDLMLQISKEIQEIKDSINERNKGNERNQDNDIKSEENTEKSYIIPIITSITSISVGILCYRFFKIIKL